MPKRAVNTSGITRLLVIAESPVECFVGVKNVSRVNPVELPVNKNNIDSRFCCAEMDEESQAAAYCLLAMSRAAERDFNALSAALGHRTVMEQQQEVSSSSSASTSSTSTFPAAANTREEDDEEKAATAAAAASAVVVGDPSQFMIARILSDLTRVRQVFNVQQTPTQEGMHARCFS